ncbi:MAG TPA: KTSC domain-containing protein [Polyangiaceae bacterium]|nr:KTSC domain-containing protein [Polyangiaceae bacterium]
MVYNQCAMPSADFKSNAVKRAEYDAEGQALIIEFSSGRTYRYKNVPQSVYDWCVRSKSKGAFLTRLVKDKYEFEEITEAPPQADLGSDLAASLAALRAKQQAKL